MISDEKLQMLRLLTEQTFGKIVRTPNDFNMLILDIRERTGESISMSTLKRIWRYVSSTHQPSYTILSILASYNGFIDYEDFEKKITVSDELDSEFFIGKTIMCASLSTGDEVELRWGKGKSCRLEVTDPESFVVKEAENIKLAPGNKFQCSLFCEGYPFTARNVVREEGVSPVYIAALKTGIESIIVRKNTKN